MEEKGEKRGEGRGRGSCRGGTGGSGGRRGRKGAEKRKQMSAFFCKVRRNSKPQLQTAERAFTDHGTVSLESR